MLGKFQAESTRAFKPHVALNAHQARILDWGIGLGGEAGEVQELLKHHIYAGEPIDKMLLAKELGDVFWYLCAIAETMGIEMTDVAELNMAKLNHRYHNGKYSDNEAQERRAREAVFTDTPIYKVLQSRITGSIAPMNVIFIGPDGSGKTTIAKEVAERMGFKYHKCDYRQENKPELAKQLLEEQIDVVYDRFYWPDDALYCTVKAIKQPEAYWRKYDVVIDMLQERNTLYIYVTCNRAELAARSKVWKDDYVSVEQINSICKAYNAWWRYIEPLKLSMFMLDTTGIVVGTREYQSMIDGCCSAIEAGQHVYANREE